MLCFAFLLTTRFLYIQNTNTKFKPRVLSCCLRVYVCDCVCWKKLNTNKIEKKYCCFKSGQATLMPIASAFGFTPESDSQPQQHWVRQRQEQRYKREPKTPSVDFSSNVRHMLKELSTSDYRARGTCAIRLLIYLFTVLSIARTENQSIYCL